MPASNLSKQQRRKLDPTRSGGKSSHPNNETMRQRTRERGWQDSRVVSQRRFRPLNFPTEPVAALSVSAATRFGYELFLSLPRKIGPAGLKTVEIGGFI